MPRQIDYEAEASLPDEIARRLARALQNLRFGTITLVIQDGKIIQIDRNEKFRLK